jgi:ribulose-phosphate 3-epimerase
MTMKPNKNWFYALPGDRLLAEISLWSADLLAIGADMDRIDRHTDLYHLDVTDGHFSPALLLFPDLVKAIRGRTSKPLHVHLMMQDAILSEQITQFSDAGADLVSIHAENISVGSAIDKIRRLGMRAGLVLTLDTPVAHIEEHLDKVSFVTLLGTRIGVKGRGLDESALERMAAARHIIESRPHANRIVLAADGAIREHTVPDLRRAGADAVVMGSLAFAEKELDARMDWVRKMPSAP